MEHLAWQLLETKRDIVGAERVFAQLANRARLAPVESGGAANAASLAAAQRMCAAVVAVHEPPSAAEAMTSGSRLGSVSGTPCVRVRNGAYRT